MFFDEDINLRISISGLSFYNLSNEVVQVFNIELERNTNRLKIALSYNIDQKGYTKNSVDLFVNNYEYMCSVK